MTEILTRQRVAAGPRFAWLLPGVFAAATSAAAAFPGHGWQLFGIGGLAGVWACFLVAGDGTAHWLVPTLLGGMPILWYLGRLLDRLHSELWVWLAALAVGTVAAGYSLLQAFPDLEAAVEFHGSFLAYCICALQLGSYGATLVALAIGAGRSAVR
ncbi:MAG: hypothetical protein WAT39_04940 [Planctomycetota bacterium]